jgi:hypothetical protein
MSIKISLAAHCAKLNPVNLVHNPIRTFHNSGPIVNINIYANIEQIKLIYKFFKIYARGV